MTTTDRAAYIAGLRAIVDALEAQPHLPLPYAGTGSQMSVYCRTREEMAAWARVLTGKVDKQIDENPSYGFRLSGGVLGVGVLVMVHRDEVCTRRVTGTTEVVEQVPDPAALAKVPTVEVTRTVETVAWDCHPILSATVDEPVMV